MLTKNELASVLVALRHFQATTSIERRAALNQLSDPDDDITPMGDIELDALCEKLNTMEPHVIVTLEGGLIQDIWANVPGIAFTRIDYDVEGAEEEDTARDPYGGSCCPVFTEEVECKPEQTAEFLQALNGKTRKYKIALTRRYYVSKTYEVEAENSEEAKALAESMSSNEDFTGKLQFDDVLTDIVEDRPNA